MTPRLPLFFDTVALLLCSVYSYQSFQIPSSSIPNLQSAVQVAADGDEIVIEPGIYFDQGFCGIVVSDISNLTITGISSHSNELTIIDCSSFSGRILTFNSTAAAAASSSIFSLRYLTFRGGTSPDSGGAVAFVSPCTTVVTISHCSFLANIANGAGEDGGGAVYFVGYQNHSSIQVINSNFSFNTAVNGNAGGGGMFILFPNTVSGASVLISGGHFNGNLAKGGGGLYMQFNNDVINSSIIVQGGSHVKNSAKKYGGGGCQIWIEGNTENCDIVMQDGWYEKNVASHSGGGAALYFNSQLVNSNVLLKNAAYDSNYAGNSGGAIVIWVIGKTSNSSIGVTNGTFNGNQAQGEGGGIELSLDQDVFGLTVTIQQGMYLNNIASQGGALSVSLASQDFVPIVSVVAVDVIFINNSALLGSGGGGGAMSIIFPNRINATTHPSSSSSSSSSAFDTLVDISHCAFDSNVASGLGGAAMFVMPPGISLESQCAMCVPSKQQQDLNVPLSDPICNLVVDPRYCTQTHYVTNFLQNYYVPYQQHGQLHVHDVLFNGNYVDGMGGAMMISSGHATLSNVSFVNNLASQAAGGLYFTGTSSIYFFGRIFFQNNTATTQTTLLLSSRGSVTIDKAAVLSFYSSYPPGFSVDQGQYDAVSVLQAGQLLWHGKGEVFCPPGFTYQHRNIPISNVSVFMSGWPNVMLASTFTASCAACGVGFYSAEVGYEAFDDGVVISSNQTCHKCPFGAGCSQGRDLIVAAKDFWGYFTNSSKTWSFSPCSFGYCCQQNDGCIPRAREACVEGRDMNVALCGSCLEGYSQNMRGHSCSPDELCNDGVWIWPVLVLLAVLWCLLLLLSSSSSSSSSNQSKKNNNISIDISWLIPTLSFFYQNVYFLFVVQGGLPSPLVSIVTAIANLHVGGSSNQSGTQLCIIRGLSTLGSIVLELVVPGILMGMLALVFAVVKGIGNKVLEKRVPSAIIKTLLLSYTTIASVTATLLHCVQVTAMEMDGVAVIFKAGAVQCWIFLWQKFVIAAFALIVLPFPFMLFAIQLFMRKRGLILAGNNNSAISSIEEPYRSNIWYWPSVVLLRRLLVALVYVFIQDEAIQGISFSLLFVFFLVLHLFVAPHKSSSGNAVETSGLVILIISSQFTLRSGSYREANVLMTSVSTAEFLNEKLEMIQTVLFFVPIALTIATLLWEKLGGLLWRNVRYESRVRGWFKSSLGAELTSRLLGSNEDDNSNNYNNKNDYEQEMGERVYDLRIELQQYKDKVILLEDLLKRK